jgi:chemotaxis protein methyltransferase CheR
MNKLLKEQWDMSSIVAYVSEIVSAESGNVLNKSQESMVLSRLNKRLIDLGNLSPNAYSLHLKNNYKSEISYLVTILTTHHTFFFREFCHFEFILKELDSIIRNVKARNENKIRILSAACSRGQEVYSLAMFLNFYLKQYPEMSYEILGTDIDSESTQVASNGVYRYNEIKSVPQSFVSGNWQKGTEDIAQFVKVKKHLKEKCSFKVMNLLRPEEVIAGQKFDIIMCRNVFIYFDIKDVKMIVEKLKTNIHKGGYLITGLSESLNFIDIPKRSLAPSVYSFDLKEPDVISPKVESVQTFSSPIPKPIKILAVDDSTSVLKLLGKIFSDDKDFELVGTAKNGLEAQEFLKKNQVDAITLDIHMPEMDGVEYLKNNYNTKHPHVLVISSSSREDTRYAQQTLNYGASDFVEKPALNNLNERAEEIKNKLKMCFFQKKKETSQLDHSFKNDYFIKSPENKIRSFILNYSSLSNLQDTLNMYKGEQPPTVLFFEGNHEFLDMIEEQIIFSGEIEVFKTGTELKKNCIYLCDFKTHFKEVFSNDYSKVSISIFGLCSEKVINELINIGDTQILLEDNSFLNKDIKEIATDIFPWTSFYHVSTEYLSEDKDGD